MAAQLKQRGYHIGRKKARRYYVGTIGNVTESAIKKYIEEQSDESRKEENSTTL